MELFTHIATLGIVALIFTILMKLIFVWIYKICLSSNVDPTKAVFITKGISTYLLAIVTSTFINQFAAKEASTGTLIVWGIVGVLYLCSWLTMQIHARPRTLSIKYSSRVYEI